MLVASAIASSCSEGSSGTGSSDASGQETDGTGENDAPIQFDTGGGGFDTWVPPEGDSAQDGGPEDAAGSECPEQQWGLPCNPSEGEFGWPCVANSDCATGFCIDTAGGKVCADTCLENCPPGWVCSEVTVTGQDTLFICKPRFARLCDPCVEHTDCSDSGLSGSALCVDFGSKGRYCGADCSDGQSCPTGYTCTKVESPFGPPSDQCVPDSGECTCSPAAIEKNLDTVCTKTNAFGTCSGERYCVTAGLSDCDASVPGIELCDAIDNDCNGAIDDITVQQECDVTNQFGSCPGLVQCEGSTPTCVGPSAEAEVCDGKDNDCDGDVDEENNDLDNDDIADCIDEDDDNDGILDAADNCPVTSNGDQANFDGDGKGDACDDDDDNDNVPDTADCDPLNPQKYPGALEVCDGVDNDCNGQADDGICFDGNPCTNDTCDAVSGCVYSPKAGPCDDGSVCTQNDICSNGTCQGSLLNCDDGNPCTEDKCGPTQGCYFQNKVGAPCEDGNQCTTGDACQNGSCKSGPVQICNDGNPCTSDTCAPASGCTYNSAAMNGSLCDDDNPCTEQSVCSGGSCNGVKQKTCPPNPQCLLQTCVPLGDFPLCICL